ncbi:hypothetical protein, partial [Maritimibacter sp. 55A14]|uniref:hypothetical protein n=1 Tax=Maritimibacter sp. 55A14 TaxID=2174844 RepID=UPI001E502478
MKILAVDDDLMILELLKEAMTVKRHPILTSYRRPKMTPLWAWVAGPIRCSHHTAQPYRASGVR